MEVAATLRSILVVCLLLAVGAYVWVNYRESPSQQQLQARQSSAPTILKQPANVSKRSFDPASPPSEMPPLDEGENAECVSDFTANANVGGQTRQTDPTHATLTVTQISVTLMLNVTIWVPFDVTQRVTEHEEGHRQISEYYYLTADKLAARIASNYMGKKVEITGTDLNAESTKALQQMGAEITDEYGKELNPNPTQLLYDSITDHSRNGVDAQEAVDHALKNASIEANQPASTGPSDR